MASVLDLEIRDQGFFSILVVILVIIAIINDITMMLLQTIKPR